MTTSAAKMWSKLPLPPNAKIVVVRLVASAVMAKAQPAVRVVHPLPPLTRKTENNDAATESY